MTGEPAWPSVDRLLASGGARMNFIPLLLSTESSFYCLILFLFVNYICIMIDAFSGRLCRDGRPPSTAGPCIDVKENRNKLNKLSKLNGI